ncbi:MAG: ornithine cyclodeaminase family protein [Acidimicrobiia bacterium]
MRYLGPADLRRALPMDAAIDAMTVAFGDDREVPARVQIGPSLFMPGRVGEITGIKVVSTVPGRPSGIVVVFDPSGHPLGLVDGPTLTAIRTGAGAGLATRLLARAEAHTMAMLGCGSMAADQVAAVREVRTIERVLVWSRDFGRAEAFAARIGGVAVDDPASAVSAADIVTTATPALEPLFADTAVQAGTHINAIGSFTPAMVEIPHATVGRAFVVVDDVSAAAREAGDLIQAAREPDATLGDLLAGRIGFRGAGVTLFKSVGIASQDVAAAAAALARAGELGSGVEIDL